MTTLACKIAAASKDVGGKLKTDKRNNEQRYDYLSADLILAECGQALAEQGLVVIPSITSSEIATIARPENKFRYDATVQLALTIEDGEHEFMSAWVGVGSDYMTPDKALYKAITSGHKYFLMKLLNVGAGNEDGEHETGEAGAGHVVTIQRTATATEQAHKTTGPVPNCPKCGGAMWDNRESNAPKNAERKAQGKGALPDFKCKDKECDGAVWPPKDGANGAAKPQPAEASGPITPDQIKKIHVICGKLYKTPEEVAMYRGWLKEQYKVESSKDLTSAAASELIRSLEAAELEKTFLA